MEDKIKYYSSDDEHISKLIEIYRTEIEKLLEKYDYVSEVTVVYKPAETFKDIDEFTGEEFEVESNECLEYNFEIKDHFPIGLSEDLMELSLACIMGYDIELFPSDKIVEALI